MKENYILPQKSNLRQIKVNNIEVDLPDLKNISESKAIAIANWMMSWLKQDLASGKIKVNDLLPTKPELAYLLGVSIGTIQNSLSYIEDLGYVESKQCIGTLVKDYTNTKPSLRKLTSKRELAITEIKKYILKHKFKISQPLPSSRAISKEIGCSANTTRLALEYLGTIEIIEHKFKNANESGWILKSKDFEIEDIKQDYTDNTLVKKVTTDLKDYINSNLTIGERIPPHDRLSAILKVSIKTIHDALKNLIDEGILLARRGRYGTTVIKMPYDKNIAIKKETSIFAPAQDTAFYYYEKTQNHIKKIIAENYEIGQKLPSIIELSKEMDLSPNTIRKAFQNLAKEGYLAFSRGRYGGTFVIDIPETDEQTFKWLAVNPKYAEVYKSNN